MEIIDKKGHPVEILDELPQKLKDTKLFRNIENNIQKRISTLQNKLDELNKVKNSTNSESSEAFHLVLQELESLRNYLLCKDLERQLDQVKDDPLVKNEVKIKIEAQMNSYKAWWQLANQKIIQNYGNIATRELKKDQGDKMLDAMQISDMHRLLRGDMEDSSNVEDIDDEELKALVKGDE